MPPLPQVWVAGQYRLYHKEPGEELSAEEIKSRTEAFLEMLRWPGLYKVGGLGGCTLLGRRALEAGVSFAPLPNLDLLGEDRHFCIRAAALGLELYADTLYPPYHIYRESDLEGVAAYKERCLAEKARNHHEVFTKPSPARKARDGVRITLAMLVRNEAHRYLERVLRHAAQYIDRAVILDDASEDETVAVCRAALAGIPLTLVSNREPSFHQEHKLRRQLWDLAVGSNPGWILILDADELFEDRAVGELRLLAADPEIEVYNFRLYDFWDEEHYREDEYWQAHRVYRPFLVRYRADFRYEWRDTPQHGGRFPWNIALLKNANSPLRVKHLGWMRPADRLAKYYRYKRLDPDARYGIRGQYLSILDPRPNLVRWVEDENARPGRPA
ncbi:MAG: glycosyltransferase family 2 protein [Bacillota bacterium]